MDIRPVIECLKDHILHPRTQKTQSTLKEEYLTYISYPRTQSMDSIDMPDSITYYSCKKKNIPDFTHVIDHIQKHETYPYYSKTQLTQVVHLLQTAPPDQFIPCSLDGFQIRKNDRIVLDIRNEDKPDQNGRTGVFRRLKIDAVV